MNQVKTTFSGDSNATRERYERTRASHFISHVIPWKSFWSDKNIEILDCTDDIQLCKFTKSHWIVQLKSVNFMVYKLYLNKDVFKNGYPEKKKNCKPKRLGFGSPSVSALRLTTCPLTSVTSEIFLTFSPRSPQCVQNNFRWSIDWRPSKVQILSKKLGTGNKMWMWLAQMQNVWTLHLSSLRGLVGQWQEGWDSFSRGKHIYCLPPMCRAQCQTS